MSWSLKLFTVRGIPVRVHASFALIVLWAMYQGLTGAGETESGLAWAMAFAVARVLLLFACVVLHELGHSLVAQGFGVHVEDITLWPIGGLARMSRQPERPYQEFLLAAAGPATNLLLAVVLAGALAGWLGAPEALSFVFSPLRLGLALSRLDGRALLIWLLVGNLSLAFFNLLPAFPMDGGRLLRAFLALLLPFRRATQIASVTGQVVAAAMVGLGLLTSDLLLALVGLLIFGGAGYERRDVVLREGLAGWRVRQAMQPPGPRLHPLQTLGDVAAQVAALPQSHFLVVDGGRLVGLLSRRTLLTALRRAGPDERVAPHVQRDVMQVGPDEPLAAVQERMNEGSAWVAIVIEDGCVTGLVTGADLARVAEMSEAYPELGKR